MKYAHPVSANATAVYGPLNWGTAVLNDPAFTEFHELHLDAVLQLGRLHRSRDR